MKVNISYAVELEDIPIEVGKLITNAGYTLAVILDEIENIATSEPLNAINIIDSVRKDLSGIDLRLADSRQILSGYLDLKTEDTILPEESSE